jgi:phosphoserine phosphatase
MNTTVIMVRHGQTEWNRVERFRGQADVPLNHTGLMQAASTGERIASSWKPVAVYSSPLSRAVKTAQATASLLNLAVQIHPDLADIDYGKWQGLTPEEVSVDWPEVLEAWYKTPHLACIPGGESLAQLRNRAMAAINALAEHHLGQTIVVVGHTVINRIILLGILGLGNERFWSLRQEPCAINVLEVGSADYILVSMNDTCHLQELSAKG